MAWSAAYLQSTNGINQPVDSVGRKEAAEVVLANLAECSEVLDELQESSKRKYSRFNLRYNNDDPAAILLPHLTVLKHICQILQLRATAELAVGKRTKTFSDINFSGARFSNLNLTNVEIDACNTTGMKFRGVLVADLFDAYRKKA